MKKKKNPFLRIRKRQASLWADFASRAATGGPTVRMFKGGSAPRIREFLRERIGDGRRLAHSDSERKFWGKLRLVIDGLRKKIRTNKNRKPSFGQSAKVVNLYLRHLVCAPTFIKNGAAARLTRRAHLPLDGVVLEHIWRDFAAEREFRKLGMARPPSLRDLDEETYKKLQRIVKHAAKPTALPVVSYDLLWSERTR